MFLLKNAFEWFLKILGLRWQQVLWTGSAILAAFLALAGAAWYLDIPDVLCFNLFGALYWLFIYLSIYIEYERTKKWIWIKKRWLFRKRKIYPRENLNSYIQSQTTRKLVLLKIIGDYIIPTLLSFVFLYIFGLPLVCFCDSGDGDGDGEEKTSGGGEEANASSWETFDLDVIAEFCRSRTAGTPENQPEAVPVPPGNPVASPGEEAGPSNNLGLVPFPYQPDEVIGGDCVDAIQRRLLTRYSYPSSEVIQRMQIKAEDLFEVKVEIIKIMAGLDPTGDWMGKGARALDNSRTATGEERLEKLYALLEDLNRGGVQSEAYNKLKGKVHFRIVPEEHSSA